MVKELEVASTAPSDSSMAVEAINQKLFTSAMNGKWKEVIDTYAKHQDAHKAKITKSGDTALHIAVLDGQESTVEQLMKEITKNQNFMEVLKIGNELGNTPFHLAASIGNVKMCKLIANADAESELIGQRNNEKMTPLFLAVLHGKKDAFLCLYSACKQVDSYSFCTKDDGETILHCAIFGEYFDLAFQIIHLYPKLVNKVNVEGVSPLHLLANKPSAFRSGTHVKGFLKIIYHCIFVDELEAESLKYTLSKGLQYDTNAKYPENYQTCIGFVHLLRNIFQVLTGHQRNKEEQSDAENPSGQQSSTSDGNKEKSHANNPKEQQDEQGSRGIAKLREKKEKHIWSVQIMNKLVEQGSTHRYENNGRSPQPYTVGATSDAPHRIGNPSFQLELPSKPPPDYDQQPNISQHSEVDRNVWGDKKNTVLALKGKHESGGSRDKRPYIEPGDTPILIAAKNGVVEMVEKILELFPVAMHDMNSDKKNIVLLAVENRHPHVYQFLLNKKIMKETILRKLDKDGNSALHLAAKLGEHRPWLIPGAALQMQWEIKWYEFVKNSMPLHFFTRYNKKGETARDIFSDSHEKLVESGGQWLTNTSESCSVVAALIATVAFATSTTFPGGFNEGSTKPLFENEPAFDIFAISSLVALCFSVTSVVMFLAILTSRFQEKDFYKDLPNKILMGLTTLFVSIASILISFCAGHFFILKDKLKYAAFPVYAVTCLPVTVFAMAQFPLYFDLVQATFKKVPQRSYG